MRNQHILISGAGIAGLTLAFWLKKFGFNPVVIERASAIPQGGYMIDFFGKGVDVAYKMGLQNALEVADSKIREIEFVNENNKKTGGYDAESFRKLLKEPFHTLLRSELVNIIHNALIGNVEILFNKTIASIQQDDTSVGVIFNDGTSSSYDLVIGADGIHSNVRKLVFGPESEYEEFFGFYTSSFTTSNFIKTAPRYLSYTVPGKQVAVYPVKGNKLTAFFVFKTNKKLRSHEPDFQKNVLKEVYSDMKWYTPELLERMDEAPDFYFDVVSQIQMKEWSKGRISLAGDACDCPSLLSGQGSTLAMIGAYILAGELKEANGYYVKAFENYQQIFKPFIDNKQKLAKDFSGSFVPSSYFSLWVRNTFSNLMFLPFISKWVVNKFVVDHIKLKDY